MRIVARHVDIPSRIVHRGFNFNACHNCELLLWQHALNRRKIRWIANQKAIMFDHRFGIPATLVQQRIWRPILIMAPQEASNVIQRLCPSVSEW